MNNLTNRMDYLLSTNKQRRADLVRGTGISEGTIRSWYTKGACPSVDAAYKVAQYFGVTVEWLITGKEEKDSLSAEERELLKLFRALDERDKNTILTLSRSLEEQYCAADRLSGASG